MSKQKMKNSEIVENRLNRLTGEILTIIEAIIPPVEQDLMLSFGGNISSTSTMAGLSDRPNTQREAIKDLVKSAFSQAHIDLSNWIED